MLLLIVLTCEQCFRFTVVCAGERFIGLGKQCHHLYPQVDIVTSSCNGYFVALLWLNVLIMLHLVTVTNNSNC